MKSDGAPSSFYVLAVAFAGFAVLDKIFAVRGSAALSIMLVTHIIATLWTDERPKSA